ncbi:branched-chain amino acid ABC transporter permease [Salinisphaera orenii MK-B5]|uniref:Branched-chain amino acid ABC transporter permease n=1 Tax=Salinisphaera orenii MK-B5 TaxID=856730 RepID=A0A423PF53_9GAMM|nr:urea ABC transporter permease subunit UrtB [Salinisphaera orenii]ROO24200.1 branched-chain amino acid ABC transporter permease [Salinisphaera orenii MK-B5]
MDYSWAPLMGSLVLGLSIASIWLVAALGLTIIYGTAGVINMAHGEFIMLGAYAAYCAQAYLGTPFLLCLPISFVVVALIGLFFERVLIRYLYHRPLDTLLATWGVSLMLTQGVRMIFGSSPKYVQVPEFLSGNVSLGIMNMSSLRILIVLMTVVLIVGIWYLFYRTYFGIKIRAVTQNREMAASFGVNSERIYMCTFALGAGLAGVAGCLFSALAIVLPTMGSNYVVESFLVVVTGGGPLVGSIAASAMMGEFKSFFSYFFNSTFAQFLLFVLIVIVLRFRPNGLFANTAVRR